MADRHDDGDRRRMDARAAALGAEAGSFPLPAGTVLEGRFVIRSVLGRGGFGVTYMAEHTGIGRRIALKEHFPEQFAVRQGTSVRPTSSGAAMFQWGLDRFMDEARRLGRMKHPSIVDVTDVFEANGTAYMALAYEDGETLGRWLDRLGRRPAQAELDRLLTPILDALEHVHGHDILHRDIAPDNIMLRRNGTPVLIDFGAARTALAAKSQLLTGIVKHGYSPPEQYGSKLDRQGPWTDIYALGATLYRCLAGRAPPPAPDRQIEDELEAAMSLRGEYRAGFLRAIDRALALRFADRPQSVADWADELLSDTRDRGVASSRHVTSPARTTHSPAGAGSVGNSSPAAASAPAPGERPRSSIGVVPGALAVLALVAALAGVVTYAGSKRTVGEQAPSPTASTSFGTQAGTSTTRTSQAGFDIRPATNIEGPILVNELLPSFEHCRSACERDAACRGFAFGNKINRCYTYASISRVVASDLWRAGIRATGPLPPQQRTAEPPAATKTTPSVRRGSFELVENTLVDGDIIDNREVESAAACSSLCDQNTRCRAYSIGTKVRRCYTYATVRRASGNALWQSGFKPGARPAK